MNGASQLSAVTNAYYRNGLRAQATQALIDQGANDPNLLVNSYAGIYQNAESKVVLVDNALKAAGDLSTVFPAAAAQDWGLSQQLHEVARVIKAQSQIGDSRQLFFVQLGGFDTHSGQMATQSMLLGYVSRYVNAFWSAMGEIGMQSNVTLFTMSDFGLNADVEWQRGRPWLGETIRSSWAAASPAANFTAACRTSRSADPTISAKGGWCRLLRWISTRPRSRGGLALPIPISIPSSAICRISPYAIWASWADLAQAPHFARR